MVRIIHQREKCIGCNYCVEVAFNRWRMSKKDGKSVLLGAQDKKGFHSVVVGDDELNDNLKAANYCPVNIIKVEKIR